MAHRLSCPKCNRRINVPKAIRCPSCGARLTKAVAAPDDEDYELVEEEGFELVEDAGSPPTPAARPKGPRKKRKKKAAPKRSLLVPALAIGGGLLGVVLLIGGLVLLFRNKGPGGAGDVVSSLLGGGTAVIDELPDPPAAEDSPQPAPEPEARKGTSRTAWTGKPDPATKPVDYSHAVGAATPEQLILLAAQNGPYAMGVPIFSEPAQRVKNVKTNDPNKPWKIVPLADASFPVVDILTGKEVGTFPASCKLSRYYRLSSDGQYLAGFQIQFDPVKRTNLAVLAVWKRGNDQPVLRWLVPGPVFWMEFLGPDRLALAINGRTPRLFVLEATKSEPVVGVPLPADVFPPTPDEYGPDTLPPFTNQQYPCGAVSPGGNYVALAGKGAVSVLATADGKLVGKLRTSPELGIKNYWALAFDEAGTELRVGFGVQNQQTLHIWSMKHGQILHSGPCEVVSPEVLSGPEKGTLIIGGVVVDLESGKPIADVPGGIQRWAGPDHYLAQLPQSAVNAKALEQTTDFEIMKGSFLTPFKRTEYQTRATAFAAERAKAAVTRPQTSLADRTRVVIIQPRANPPWGVKASPPPPLPPEYSLAIWPEAFAATEAAVIRDGRSWVRYDLTTGKPIGQAVRLWPDSVVGLGGANGRLLALALDGKRLALVDPIDPTRVDIWESSGKRLIGLRPYMIDPITWLGWSSNGQLLTATTDLITGWDVATGKALFEIEGTYKSFTLAPGCSWLMATTPAGNLDFFDAANGKQLGRLPGSTVVSLAPDGKTLVCESPGIVVWDLESGKRSPAPEMPIGLVIGSWVGPRCTIRYMDTQGNTPARYLLYDLDMHTNTYSFANVPPIEVRNDSFGRSWMARFGPAGRGPNNAPWGWGPVRLQGKDGFRGELAFGPGSTIRVEINVGHGTYNQKFAQGTAQQLQRRGLKIGRDGWVLRADYKVGTSSRKYTEPVSGKQSISVASLTITWKLIAPDGTEVWQNFDGGDFDPFRSKYVKVGSRRGQVNPRQGGYQQVELDFGGRDSQSAQIEEILEQTLMNRNGPPPGLPACVVRKGSGYEPLPIKGSLDGAQKP
ncbi:MAG TPA: WD40 repeat domain-containing protein [Gemmataceae bacterium]|nr:WD40 repeat domain-containing protein [Gemmataceae bacterium]